jgi:hypothetical protein
MSPSFANPYIVLKNTLEITVRGLEGIDLRESDLDSRRNLLPFVWCFVCRAVSLAAGLGDSVGKGRVVCRISRYVETGGLPAYMVWAELGPRFPPEARFRWGERLGPRATAALAARHVGEN